VPIRPPIAFTLLEVLVVIVLLSLVTSLGVASMSRASGAARLREAAQMVRWADAQARLRARSGETVSLFVRDNGRRLELRGEGQRLHAAALPTGVTLEIVCAARETPVPVVSYDASGRSPDLLVLVHGGLGTHRWELSGTTGFMRKSAGEH